MQWVFFAFLMHFDMFRALGDYRPGRITVDAANVQPNGNRNVSELHFEEPKSRRVLMNCFLLLLLLFFLPSAFMIVTTAQHRVCTVCRWLLHAMHVVLSLIEYTLFLCAEK
jgi:hypothetical protein